jgi:hypothetical protein
MLLRIQLKNIILNECNKKMSIQYQKRIYTPIHTQAVRLIQERYRHHLSGKRLRMKMAIKMTCYYFIPYKIACIWDESDYCKSKSHTLRDFVLCMVECINKLCHQDSDDTENYSLTLSQTDILNKILSHPRVTRIDVNTFLRSLTIWQLMLIR